ncbi:THAP domain-containing protein 6-like isoform X2 [Archocentrus centrarchus]|uniref:THAP domain-containing protein 6-like isoform X2 n=1 Tax=Archocentrus centrarchus TaxID=63155 RepID=UPI0011E9E79F|nr:THAP domain-containing protein 6-like isoform X2 [Archocentrus centrarchus]
MWQTRIMPHSCAAWKCSNRFTVETRSHGITFHRFPKDKGLRKQWELATRRKGFSASPSSMLCSEHFRPEDFDRTGQSVRIRYGAVTTRTSQTSKKALEPLPVHCSQVVQQTKPLALHSVDHSYALPSSPDDLRVRLNKAIARVESLEREKRNAKDRERRARNTVCGLLEYLSGKQLINEELKERLSLYSDLPVHHLSKQTKEG